MYTMILAAVIPMASVVLAGVAAVLTGRNTGAY